MNFTDEQLHFLESLAPLFWWLSPEEIIDDLQHTLAGIMDRGSMSQWADMEKLFSPETIIRAIENARSGDFHSWSWRFWRARYGLDPGKPLPARMPGLVFPSGTDWFKPLQKQIEHERLDWLKNIIRNNKNAV